MTTSIRRAPGPMIYRAEEWEHGMLCEFCEQPFRDGDEIHVNFLAMVGSGVPVMGDSKCPRCFVKGERHDN